MTKNKHIERHIELHKSLDELIADWISCSTGETRLPSKASLMEFMSWAFKQTKDPDLPSWEKHNMMTPKTFIEKAIEEGYGYRIDDGNYNHPDKYFEKPVKSLEQILLDPLAWQAVGRVEGWVGISKKSLKVGDSYYLCENNDTIQENDDIYPAWQYHMHRMIDALAEGKTIADFLKSI